MDKLIYIENEIVYFIWFIFETIKLINNLYFKNGCYFESIYLY